MSCQSCASLNEREFGAEMMIHASGPIRVDDPGIMAFPKISICIDCGASRFTITEAQRQLLREGIARLLNPCRQSNLAS